MAKMPSCRPQHWFYLTIGFWSKGKVCELKGSVFFMLPHQLVVQCVLFSRPCGHLLETPAYNHILSVKRCGRTDESESRSSASSTIAVIFRVSCARALERCPVVSWRSPTHDGETAARRKRWRRVLLSWCRCPCCKLFFTSF